MPINLMNRKLQMVYSCSRYLAEKKKKGQSASPCYTGKALEKLTNCLDSISGECPEEVGS